MKTSRTQEGGNVMREAAAWKIRLHEDPHNDVLKTRFEEWRALDTRHDRAWHRIERAWNVTGELSATATLPASPPVLSLRPPAPPRQTFWRNPFRLAACAMVPALACAIAFAAPDLLIRLQADYYTKTGETRTVALPDGSSVILAARSAIALHYSGKERGITLLAGEAFFTVLHDEKRGFSVQAASVTTSDIGTAFDIRMAGPHVAVAVREGVVSVSRRDNSSVGLHLTAGQQWTLNQQNGQTERTDIDAETVGSWSSGHLELSGLTLSEAVEELGRYYPGIVLTHGLEGDKTPMGGVYDLHHPKEALAAICALHGGRLISLPAGFVLAVAGQSHS
ncbi:FecR family protein [Acetobacter conturbans]|uniref:DUF4880 domain-containing protein n=1 Tax=Acetobacter conturbans TaxID=1737472 RepID=A0ABX0JXN6_9PROT|nr:FecR domain-containing protein [Acetobacter conturbans]NHN87321.1 DUF4880 domain-containing protein [Acetobacter conturbans]